MSESKPTVPCRLTGEDGNIFLVMSRASFALKAHDRDEDATRMTTRAMNAGSYPEALLIIQEYVHDSEED